VKTLVVLVLATLPLGCSFYYSSESSVKTLTSPSRSSGSSAKSAPSEDEKDAYRDDVRDFTAAYAADHSDLEVFERGLAEVARRHGITDWEADDATYVGVGAGLKRANVGDRALATYETTIGRATPAKMALIRGGYES
jgi:hypothetical protein